MSKLQLPTADLGVSRGEAPNSAPGLAGLVAKAPNLSSSPSRGIWLRICSGPAVSDSLSSSNITNQIQCPGIYNIDDVKI